MKTKKIVTTNRKLNNFSTKLFQNPLITYRKSIKENDNSEYMNSFFNPFTGV